MISDTRQSFSQEHKNRPISCTTNPVGMGICAETMIQGFSDRLSVPVLSPYAYQKASSLVPAEVADWDETTGTVHPPLDLDDRKTLISNGRNPSVSDVQFHQQMAYAVCASTYNVFRSALGRDPSWGFLPRPEENRPVLDECCGV